MIDPICKFNHSIASAINCTRFIYETTGAQSTPAHATCHHMGLVLRGSGRLTADGECLTITEGDVYFIKKGCRFSILRDGDMEYFYISFHGWHADELVERISPRQYARVFSGYTEIATLWRDCFNRAEEGNLDLFSEAALLYTVARLSKTQKEKNDLSEKVCAYVNDHFTSPDLSISDIAARLGYDAKYLSALFKAKHNITFTKYLRDLRVKHAAFLLEQGVESVKVVAMLSGFSDALYFSRIFKQETGLSPSDYIKRIADGRGSE